MNKLKFILIAGAEGVGKDTFLDHIQSNQVNSGNTNCQILTYSTEDLAQQSLELCGWNKLKNNDIRQLLKSLTQLSEQSGKFFEYLKNAIIEELDNTITFPEKIFVLLQVRNPAVINSTLNYIIPDIIKHFENEITASPTINVLLKRPGADKETITLTSENKFDYKFEISTGIEHTLKAADAFLDILLSDEDILS